MEPIFILRQVVEKPSATKKSLHLRLIDVEEAYDGTPRSKLGNGMRYHEVSSCHISIVLTMYRGAKTNVKTVWMTTNNFSVRVVLHQSSASFPNSS